MSARNIYIFVLDPNGEGNVQRIVVKDDTNLEYFMTKVRQQFHHLYRHVDGRERCRRCRNHLESVYYDNDGRLIEAGPVVKIMNEGVWEQLKEIARNTRHRCVDVRYVRFHCYNAR